MYRKLAAITTMILMALASASTADAQTWQSGSTKYRERYPVFFGTSGTVKLSARLLTGADGKTELVATTGDIDSTTPGAGNLIGLLMTSADGRGRVVYSNLFTNSNGTGRFTKTFTGLVPGQPFFLQGIVLKTVSGRLGIYYVNVSARVQRRPDLYVHDIIVPARVPVFTPVQITALVSEVNGHVGARTDCVMYVNDVEKDRAPGIWVDSGDSVSCAFTHTFLATGTGTIKVTAEQVKPGDWDNSNNSASTPVEVFTPEYDGYGANGVIFELNRVGTRDYGRFVNSSLTAGQDFIFETLTTAVGDVFEYAGLKVGVPGVMPTKVKVSASDGTTDWSVEKDLAQCETLDVGTSGGRVYWVYVLGCNGSLWVQAGSNAGSVTYTSINWTRNFNVINGVVVPGAPVQVIENRTEVVAPATFTGTTWNLDVAVDVAGVTYTGPITLDVTTPFDLGEVTTVCNSQTNLVHCTDSGWRQKGTLGTFIKSLTPPLPTPPTPPGGGGGSQP
jgi:hypothetical protein